MAHTGGWNGLELSWLKLAEDDSGMLMLMPAACRDEVRWHGMLLAWMGLGWACIGLAEAEMGCQWHADADADASGWWGEVRWQF